MDHMTDNYDYKIIHFDSSIAKFTSSSNICDYYLSLIEPLRNVYKINIITSLINLPTNSPLNNSLEPIYIDFNNYNRLITKNYIKNNDSSDNDIKFFDSIIIENKTSITDNNVYKNDFNTSDSIFMLNPIEPQFNRINIRLFDKNNSLINKDQIIKFVMKIGIYYNNKKTTRI